MEKIANLLFKIGNWFTKLSIKLGKGIQVDTHGMDVNLFKLMPDGYYDCQLKDKDIPWKKRVEKKN